MCNIKDHPFFQEYHLQETDIISLKSLYKSGINIHMPVNPNNKQGIETEVSFMNNEGHSITLFKNIFERKHSSIAVSNLAYRFLFKDESVYFAFIKELSKILLLGFYAQAYSNTYGNNNPAESDGIKVPIIIMPGPKTQPEVENQPIVPERKNGELIGITVKYIRLQITGKPNATKCYKAIMNYSIDNFSDFILNSAALRKRFKEVPDDPAFGRGIYYKRIIGHNGLYYSTYQDTAEKERIMKEIAQELGLPLQFIYA